MVSPLSEWPVTAVPSYEEPPDEINDQMVQYYRKSGHALVSGCTVDCNWFDAFVSRYCSLQKLVKGMAHFLRFLRWLGRASRFKTSKEVKSKSTSSAEYHEPFQLLVYLDQRFHYNDKYQPSGAGGTRSPPATPHRLQRRTTCNTSLPNLSKMADRAWKYVKPYVIEPSDQLLLNKFFDPSTPSMRT